MNRTGFFARAVGLAAAMVGGVTAVVAPAARAQVQSLADRIPAAANAVVAVNVEQFRQSSVARKEGWANNDGAGPLPNVAGLKEMLVAARLRTPAMTPVWEVGLLRVADLPNAQSLARRTSGYVDTIAGRPAVWAAPGIYYVPLGEGLLGAAYPDDRQFAVQWLTQYGAASAATSAAPGASARPGAASTGAPPAPAPGQPGPSPYLRQAVLRTDPNSPVVIAIDLTDAMSEPAALAMLRLDPPSALASAKVPEEAAAKILGSIRGVTVQVNLTSEQPSALAVIEFGAPTTPLANVAKPLLLEVVTDRGLALRDLEQWNVTTPGNTIRAEGPLSADGLTQLLGIARAPSGNVTKGKEEGGDAREAAARASQAYFKAADGIMSQNVTSSSLSGRSAVLERNARRIDQLPLVNVDPDLAAWGASASASLRESATILDAGQQKVRARSLSADRPADYLYGGNDADRQAAARARADRENARRRQQQMASEETAKVFEEANKPIQKAMEERAKVRSEMSQRYGVAF